MVISKRDSSSILIYCFLTAALLSLIFVGVYEPGKMVPRPLFMPRKRQVTVALGERSSYRAYRVVTPVKTKADRSSRLNRNTPFISKKESAFSGRNSKKKVFKWAKADTQPANRVGAKRRVKQVDKTQERGETVKKKNQLARNKALFPVDKGSIFRFDEKAWKAANKGGSVFQELPDRIGKTDLLVNFNSRGQISLGTLAYRYSDYFYNMVKRISEQWRIYFPVYQHYYGFLREGEVLVRFELDIDGKVRWVKLEKSYGQHSLDHACLTAIREAKNFGPLPGDFRKKGKMVVPFLFVYHKPKKKMKMFH